MVWDKRFMLLFHKQFWLLDITDLRKKTQADPPPVQQGCSEASPISPLETFTELLPNHHDRESVELYLSLSFT